MQSLGMDVRVGTGGEEGTLLATAQLLQSGIPPQSSFNVEADSEDEKDDESESSDKTNDLRALFGDDEE